MRDDFLTREYADNRAAANEGLAAFFRDIGRGLARLNAIQYDAPWKRDRAIGNKPC